jgi:ribose transport system substrate-binding protein
MAMGAKKAFQELVDPDTRERWLDVPYIGCDGVPKTGQAWVRSILLAATVITPPLAGQALEMMATARNGNLPPELTLAAPKSFPALESLRANQELPGKVAAKHRAGT